MKYILFLLFPLCCTKSFAQELFVFTEPASNMPAKAVGLRLNNYLMKEAPANRYTYQLLPEIMLGISKKIMLHGELFFSTRKKSMAYEGGSIYFKYRFFSIDEVHSHFRLAAFGRYSRNNSSIDQRAIEFDGYNSGYGAGIIATRLLNKTAMSASVAVLHANNNGQEKFTYPDAERNAISYTLSFGRLMLPKEYISYGQTNLNLMCELLGQTNEGNGKTYFDVAPSAQLIFNSRARLDLGYRWPVVKDLYRTSAQGIIVRLEYNFFNVL